MVLRFLDPVFPLSLYPEAMEKVRGQTGIGGFEERERWLTLLLWEMGKEV